MPERDHAEEARQTLHEDRVSPNVARALDRMSAKRWILHHSRDYLLGVLQLLEAAHLLRDVEAEQESETRLRATLTELRTQLKGYKRLAYIASEILPPTFRAEVDRIAKARTGDDLDATPLTVLMVAGWAHGGSGEDAKALARVRRLAASSYRRKTITRQALLEALGEAPASEVTEPIGA